jgi:hypothetical protein
MRMDARLTAPSRLGRCMSKPRKASIEHADNARVDSRPLFLTRTRHVQGREAAGQQPLPHGCGNTDSRWRIQLHDQVRFAQRLAKPDCLQGASVESADVEDQGCVAVTNVQLGSLPVAGRLRLRQLVTVRQHTVGSQTALWAPSRVRNSPKDCPIERGPIGTGLTTGDDAGDQPWVDWTHFCGSRPITSKHSAVHRPSATDPVGQPDPRGATR